MERLMARIKFKAWHWQSKRMFRVQEIFFSRNEISGTWFDDTKETGPLNLDGCDLLQGIGLKDMHGQEMFEGDLIDDTCNRIGINQSALVIRWDPKETRFCLYDEKGRQIWWHPHLQQIIGNIYENRSLWYGK
jgi:uncharacterized phage protein (TIGR01671 family)